VRLKDFGITEHPSIAFRPIENPLKPTTTRRRNFLETVWKHDGVVFGDVIQAADVDSSESGPNGRNREEDAPLSD
jgi:hypothetical protein